MRRGVGWTVLLVAILLNCTAFGQTYPSRTITLIVPYAAGGGVDAVARVIADALGVRLGQKIIIENVTGAGGVIGTQRAARAQPDGYTLLIWYGLFAPARVDHEIVQRLSEALAATVHDPAMRSNLLEIQLVNPVGSTPAELAALLNQEIATYSSLVKAANIKVE
jgi:tripartite-type tricarboxylate transporter receptor subunit TctC